MKIKTALTTLFACLILILSSCEIFAQTYFEGVGGDVNVNANITQDLYSQLSISPSTVEISQPSQVDIHMLDANGDPKGGRTIVIYINGNSTGISISQPSVSDSNGYTSGSVSSSLAGTYEVCAKDTTGGLNIYLLDCETLYVVPVAIPSILPEPQYTKGDSNTIAWTTSGTGSYTYRVQMSNTSSFTTIVGTSGWISSQSYDFTNLTSGQIYFYRVKAKNLYGAESGWSNLVYSVQDSSDPEITLLSITGIGSNTTKDWEAQDVLTFKLRVKDNIGIQSKSFWCVLTDSTPKDCMYFNETNGDIWTVKVKLGDLEHDENYYLYTQYSFCAEALDQVGNIKRICNITVDIPETSTTPTNPIIPIIEKIKDTVNEVIDNSFRIAQNTIGKLNISSLQQISLTITIGNLLVGMGILIGGIGTIPYVLLQVFLALFSLLGFRKKGHPTGYVYDSITKEPIPQCIVRVFNENNSLVWTDVTDNSGFFRSNELKVGEYSLKVTARNYEFPSKVIFGKTDFPLENVYHGQEFYSSTGNIPNFSIPMDQKDMGNVQYVFSQFAFIIKVLWKFFHIILFVIGLIFSIYALSVSNTWYNNLIIIMYIPSLVILIFSLFSKREKYGVVKDIKGNRLSGIVLGLREKEFNKLISKRVTDSNGRFRFFTNPGVYDMVVLSPDWSVVEDKHMNDIKVKREQILIRNVVLKKVVPEKKVQKVKVEEVLEPLEEL